MKNIDIILKKINHAIESEIRLINAASEAGFINAGYPSIGEKNVALLSKARTDLILNELHEEVESRKGCNPSDSSK